MSLQQANIIDAMGFDEAAGRVLLIIVNKEPWDGSDAQLYHLQEKLNAYISFGLDGEMTSAFPDWTGKPITLRIDSATQPDARTLHLLGHVRQQLAFQDIPLEMRVLQPGDATPPDTAGQSCGSGCHCH